MCVCVCKTEQVEGREIIFWENSQPALVLSTFRPVWSLLNILLPHNRYRPPNLHQDLRLLLVCWCQLEPLGCIHGSQNHLEMQLLHRSQKEV